MKMRCVERCLTFPFLRNPTEKIKRLLHKTLTPPTKQKIKQFIAISTLHLFLVPEKNPLLLMLLCQAFPRKKVPTESSSILEWEKDASPRTTKGLSNFFLWRAHHDHLIRNDEKTEFVWENSRGRLFFKKSRAIEASEQVQKRLEKPRFDSKIRLREKKPNGHFYCRLDQFEAAASSPLSLANNKHPK